MLYRSVSEKYSKGSNYRIRSLWINAHTFNMIFLFFLFSERGGGERIEGGRSVFFWGKRGQGLRWLIS